MSVDLVTGAGPVGLRELKKRRTHDAIESAALRLFAQRGYDAVTCEEIAAAAEVGPATFYRHFRTKEDLVVGRGRHQVVVDAVAARPPGEGALEATRRAAVVLLAAAGDAELDALRDRIRLALSHPALRGRLYDQLKDLEAGLVGELAPRLGVAPDGVPAHAVTAAIVAAAAVALARWAEQGGCPGWYLETAFDALTAGVGAGGFPGR